MDMSTPITYWALVRLTAKCAFVRNLLRPRKNTNLVEGANVWREPTVDAENVAIDDLW
jgi:hypothetical protein